MLRPISHITDATDADGLHVMTSQSKGVVRTRHEDILVENLGRRLEEVFRTRAERLLLVKVEGQIELTDVIDVLDRASSQVRLQYGLMTERSTQHPPEPSLFMDGSSIYTRYFPLSRPALHPQTK